VLKTFEDFYLKGDYKNAVQALTEQQKNIDPGIWHYNMGTSLTKLNNLPLARFHFFMAQENGLDSKELELNQKVIESKMEITRLEKPLNLSDYLIKAGIFANTGALLSLSLLFLIIGLLKFRKSTSLKSVAAFVVAVIMPLGLSFWIDTWPKKISLDSIPIHEGPSAMFRVNSELPAGILIISQEKGEWENIIFPSRFSGWIKSNSLKRLENK
jgi:hypothetical protein